MAVAVGDDDVVRARIVRDRSRDRQRGGVGPEDAPAVGEHHGVPSPLIRERRKTKGRHGKDGVLAGAQIEISRGGDGEVGLALVGADPRAGASYHAIDWTRPTALFVGAEGAGLPSAVAGRLDARVAIAMRPPVESLSVGAAAAVLLFEAARQRASRAG